MSAAACSEKQSYVDAKSLKDKMVEDEKSEAWRLTLRLPPLPLPQVLLEYMKSRRFITTAITIYEQASARNIVPWLSKLFVARRSRKPNSPTREMNSPADHHADERYASASFKP